MYLHVYVHVYTHVYIFTCIHTHTCTRVYIPFLLVKLLEASCKCL